MFFKKKEVNKKKSKAQIKEEKQAQSNLKVLKRIWREHTKKYIWALVGVMVITSLTASSEAYSVALLKPIFDKGFEGHNNKVLFILCAQIVGLYFAKGWFYFAQTLILSHITTKTIQSIQQKIFSHFLSLDIGFFNKTSSGQMLSRVINDCNSITNIAINFITRVFKDFITCISMFALMLYYSWQLCLVIFIFFPIGAFVINIIVKKTKTVAQLSTQKGADFISQLSESFQSIKIIKSYCMEKFESKRIKNLLNSMFQLQMKTIKTTAMVTPVIESLSGLVLAGIIIFGGWQISEGYLTTGGFVTFLGAWVSVYKPLKSLVNFRIQLQAALISAERVYEMIDTKPLIKDCDDAISLKDIKADIEFKNVSFEYEEGKPILQNINIKIPHGKTIALVGPSGGGKTTIANLIPRFFEVTSGEILLNGINLNKITQDSLRKNTSLVSQEVILFDDTVKNNIAYGKGEDEYDTVSEEEIISASKSANAYKFITKMKEGYETKIGEKGVLLSGGQKQRISIARAIIKNAPILILDEATSALDTESEFEVQTALDNLMKNRTTVVIAHRLSTIKKADIIYVIEEGRVIESGSHKTLLAKKCIYSKLYNMQFKEEETT